MKNDFEDIFYSEETIRARVSEMSAQITSDYKDTVPIVIGVLKGSFIFMADLVREIDLRCEIRFVTASSYGLGVTSSGNVDIAQTLGFDVTDRDVILVEDILDSGNTLTKLKSFIGGQGVRSLKIVALLDKTSKRQVPIEADYVGFECPDAFVVGYGLDFAERYRNLPYIATLKPEIYS